jgi:hypothetical protein
VCDACASKTQPVIEPLKPVIAQKKEVLGPRQFEDLAAAELIEAYLYAPEGHVTQVMRSPKRVDGKPTPLVKPKRAVVRVTVVSEGSGHQSTVPRIRLQTNLLMCQVRKKDFWVHKVPSFCCDLTGIDKLEVPRKDIKEYLRENKETVWAKKKDGGAIKLIFEFPGPVLYDKFF